MVQNFLDMLPSNLSLTIVKVYGRICGETVEFGEMTVSTLDKPSLQHLVI